MTGSPPPVQVPSMVLASLCAQRLGLLWGGQAQAEALQLPPAGPDPLPVLRPCCP